MVNVPFGRSTVGTLGIVGAGLLAGAVAALFVEGLLPAIVATLVVLILLVARDRQS